MATTNQTPRNPAAGGPATTAPVTSAATPAPVNARAAAPPANGNGSAQAAKPSQSKTQQGAELEKVIYGDTPALDMAEATKARQHAEWKQSIQRRSELKVTGPVSTDFVADYVAYADCFELPRVVHEFVAITTAAALLNGNLWIKAGGLTIPMDFWTLLVSPSGGGRNTNIRPIRDLLAEAQIADFLQRKSWGSFPAMLQEFANQGDASILHVWREMSQMIYEFDKGHLKGGMQLPTDTFDELHSPEGKTYRDVGEDNEGKKTPDIVFKTAPRISLLATSSRSWFLNSIKPTDVSGGFIPRWCPIIAPLGPPIAWVREPDRRLFTPLANKLKQLASVKGIVNFEHLRKPYETWYAETRKRFLSSANSDFAGSFWSRHRNYIYKLAVVAELSSGSFDPSKPIRISEASWERGIGWSKKVEEGIFKLLETGFSNEGAASTNLEDLIRNAGPDGYPRTKFTQAYRDENRIAAYNRLKNLVDAEFVKVFERNTGGRAAFVLVHQDHLEAHATVVREGKLRDTEKALWKL